MFIYTDLSVNDTPAPPSATQIHAIHRDPSCDAGDAAHQLRRAESRIWGVGVASREVCLDKAPLGTDNNSWLLRHDGSCWHGNEPISTLSIIPTEGDIIGVTFDHVQLQFYINGKLADGCVASNLHTQVYPVFYVDDGAIIDVNFEKFYYEPPQGYSHIMKEQDML